MRAKLLWVAMAALATVGCSQTESLDDAGVKQSIGFSTPEIGKQNRAPISGADYPTDVPFGVFSYMLTGSKTWAADKASAVAFMDNLEVSHQSGVWKIAGAAPYYWPADAGSSLTFVCYSPLSTTGVSYDLLNSDGLTITDYVNDGLTDLMYSAEIADQKQTTAAGVVAPQFNHALTQIYFAAKTADDYSPDATVRIKSVTFNNIISKGSFKANPGGTPAWTLDGATTGDFTIYSDATGQEVTDGEATVGTALVMLPQADLSSQVQSVTVVYDLSGPGVAEETVTKELVLSGAWARNAKIKYLLTISLTEITFAPVISDWSAESNGTMN